MDPAHPTSVNDAMLVVSDMSTPNAQSDYVPKEVLDSENWFTPDLSSVYRISWKSGGGLISYGLQAERFHEVIERGEGACEVRTWECQSGPLAYVVKAMLKKKLDARFGDWCRDLKAWCEKT